MESARRRGLHLAGYAASELVCKVGSAVVHDSLAEAEYDEYLLKATFLTGARTSS